MMPPVTKRAAAWRDLVKHLAYLAENAGLDVAERFLSRAEASFADLAQQPMMGAPVRLKHPDLAGMRKWRVKDFDNHLVFYQPRAGGVSVVRVLHAASDWWSLLGFEAYRDRESCRISASKVSDGADDKRRHYHPRSRNGSERLFVGHSKSSRATPIAVFIGRPARCTAQPFFALRIMPAGRPWEACRVDSR